MNHKFQVGEIALLYPTVKRWRYLAGTQCTVTGLPDANRAQAPRCYKVDGQGIHGWAREENLRKIPPKEDDSRRVTAWGKCIWKPATLNA